MPDYNIYIHSAITSDSSHPTKPWSSSKSSATNPWDSDDNFASRFKSGVEKASGVMMNPDGLISQGIGALAKAVPWIAIAIIVSKTISTVVSTAMNYNSLETGDYYSTIEWDNFKANLNWVFKPISTSWNELQARNRYRVDDYRKDRQRALLGDSVINSYTDRGV